MVDRATLKAIERDLNGIVAAITQVSEGRARRLRMVSGIAAGKIVGAASIGGTLALISAFGTASTGTAIATLSGAAASSAQFYWIGALFGMGAVAGAVILPAVGFVLGILATFFLRRALFGRPRRPEHMREFETRALFASLHMLKPLSACLAPGETRPTRDELRIFAHEGLLPLIEMIGAHLDRPPTDAEKPCGSFAESLAVLPLRNLRRHHRHLKRAALKLAEPPARRTLGGFLRWSSRSPSNGSLKTPFGSGR